jgi:hypothetical protein
LEVPVSRHNPRVQIFPPEYFGTYASKKDGVVGTFVSLIMLQDGNQVVASLATPEEQDGSWTQNVISYFGRSKEFPVYSKCNGLGKQK